MAADSTTTQMMHGQYGGIVPELASRAHERLLAPAVESVLRETGIKST
ncbi:MAG: tRNA (adenosine(37)-N6)-threonylcarbamoyltransferase complex transferase subunit TsaD, partial [Calditrichaeota bacterium]|nr:tRNA (adenosine(37)-N6)-threonylcarbamoyltransferase complex transferase subunit TsaD [Calditrichota bacterium]